MLYIEEYPQLENFFYQKREKQIITNIEDDFDDSEDVGEKLFLFGMGRIVPKNDSDIMTSTKIINKFFSQIMEEVPEFQEKTQRKMFKDILDKFDTPDKSEIEAYVRKSMTHLNKVTKKCKRLHDEQLVRSFTIYDLVHKRNVIAKAVSDNMCLLLKDKENKYRIYFRVPEKLQRELCRGARTQAELGNNVFSPISTQEQLLIELSEMAIINVKVDGARSTYFTHSEGKAMKRKMVRTFVANRNDYCVYTFSLSSLGYKGTTEMYGGYCSYRYFHIVLDNLKMSLRHTSALENTTVGKYFFEYDEPEDAASAFCDVDHVYNRDEFYLQSFLLTTPVGHGLNAKLTHWRKRVGNWCYLLNTSKSYNY